MGHCDLPARTKTHVTSTTRTPSSFTTVDRCENGNKRDENGSCGTTGNGGGQPTTTKPAKPRTTKPARKDPREDVNVNPQIPREGAGQPTQKAEPNQAQPTEPAAPATTRRENPPAPAPETQVVTSRAVPRDEGGTPTAQPDGP